MFLSQIFYNSTILRTPNLQSSIVEASGPCKKVFHTLAPIVIPLKDDNQLTLHLSNQHMLSLCTNFHGTKTIPPSHIQ